MKFAIKTFVVLVLLQSAQAKSTKDESQRNNRLKKGVETSIISKTIKTHSGGKSHNKINGKSQSKVTDQFSNKKSDVSDKKKQKKNVIETNSIKGVKKDRELQLIGGALALTALVLAFSLDLFVNDVLSKAPTTKPTKKPTKAPSKKPSKKPSVSSKPTLSMKPSVKPSKKPSISKKPTTKKPIPSTSKPSSSPTNLITNSLDFTGFLINLWNSFWSPVVNFEIPNLD